jgi:hypothetical protein
LQLLKGISKVKRIQNIFPFKRNATKENVHPMECEKN